MSDNEGNLKPFAVTYSQYKAVFVMNLAPKGRESIP
jgi:hypothetical protein